MNNIKYLNSQKPMTAAGVGCTRLELWLVDLPKPDNDTPVSYTHLRAHETVEYGLAVQLGLVSLLCPAA